MRLGRFGTEKTVAVFLAGLFILAAVPGYAQESKGFPNRPVSFVIPWPPGTSADLAFRALGKEAEKYLGQPVVAVNKTGGGGTIGVTAIATAKPDGYTVGHCPGAGPVFILPFTEKLPYHPMKDFRFIMQFVDLNPGVVVKADSPFKTFKSLIAYAKENPKKVTYGTNAPNSMANIIIEEIARKEGVQFTHIPFKGATEYQAALLGGHLSFCAGDFQTALVDSGQTRILLQFGEKRSEDYPQVPVLKDLGYEISCPMFLAIWGPKGMPDDVVRKLESSFTEAAKEPSFLKTMKELHFTMLYRNSRQLEDYVTTNFDTYEKLLKKMGIAK